MSDVLDSNFYNLGFTISVNPSNVSHQEIVDFIKMCFEIPKAQGIIYSAYYVDESQIDIVKNNGAFVVVRKQDEIVACALVYFQKCGFMFRDKRMYIFVDCVSPKFLRQGISRKLTEFLLDFAKTKGCKYAFISTALNSPINVDRNLKNGFYKWRINSYEGTDYYSILFRKDFKKPFLLMSIWQKFRFAYSCLWCKMCKNADGSHTIVGTIIEKPLLFIRTTLISILKKIKK